MFKCKNKTYLKASENLFTFRPKNKYQIKRSCVLPEPFYKKENSASYAYIVVVHICGIP